MPLRLRRGTNTERQSITPQEGELIYVTDTKELWAGDGATQGGIKVTGIVPERLTDLADVNLSVAPQIGQVLKWNGAVFIAADDNNTNTGNSSIIEGGNYNINIVGNDSSVIVDSFNKYITGNFVGDASGLFNFPADVGVVPGGNYRINIVGNDSTTLVDTSTSTFTGNFVGDGSNLTDLVLQDGSDHRINILGFDSTIIVDVTTSSFTGNFTGDVYGIDQSIIVGSQDNSISTSIINVINNELVFTPTPEFDGINSVKINSNNDRAILKFTRTSQLDITNEQLLYGSLFFQRDDITGNTTSSIIMAGRDGIFLTADYVNNFSEASTLSIGTNGNFGIGTYTADEKLIVEGNTKVSGFVQFGSFTTTERNAIVAANGMVIYNTTSNRFEGYQNSSWINLDDGTTASS